MGVGDAAQVHLMFESATVCLTHQPMESKDVDLKDSPKKEREESSREGRNGKEE